MFPLRRANLGGLMWPTKSFEARLDRNLSCMSWQYGTCNISNTDRLLLATNRPLLVAYGQSLIHPFFCKTVHGKNDRNNVFRVSNPRFSEYKPQQSGPFLDRVAGQGPIFFPKFPGRLPIL